MIIIMDERTNVSVRIPHPSGDSQRYSVDMKMLSMAEYAVIVKDDTYEVIKDRYTGETGEFPLDELPELVKQRLMLHLRTKNQVSIDE